jgi:DNA transformation protein
MAVEGIRFIAMSASTEYTAYVLEMLEPIGPVRTGRFFGGVGILSGSVQFAMIMGNSLYFVVDDSTRPKYERAGMAPFAYTTKKGRVQVRKYFELPEDILTDPEQLRLWANESKRIAAKDKKPGKSPKRMRQKRSA